VRILLDENFPLGLLRRLQAEGIAADHIITLGWRGASDTRIRERLQDDQVLFLTHDEDFLFAKSVPAIVMISRVRQSRPLKERIEVWWPAIRTLLQTPRPERLFELTDDGLLLPWREASNQMLEGPGDA
jgi:hypothetical protein